MNIVTERMQIESVSERWERQYADFKLEDQVATQWTKRLREIGPKLKKLDLKTATADEVDAVIGNCSWTRLSCEECKEPVKAVCIIGGYQQESPARLCYNCLRAASLMFAEPLADSGVTLPDMDFESVLDYDPSGVLRRRRLLTQISEPKPKPALDWDKAKAHLKEVRQQYTDIGAPGVPTLNIVINPLLVRLEKGERTPELYEEILSLE